MYCPQCQAENPDHAQICSACNCSLTAAPPPPASVPPPPASMPPSAASAPPSIPPQPMKTCGLAIASLVLGILGFVTCGLTGILGLILGIVALSQISRKPLDLKGQPLAIVGITLSAVAFVVLWSKEQSGS